MNEMSSSSKNYKVWKQQQLVSYLEKEKIFARRAKSPVSAVDFYASIFRDPFQSERSCILGASTGDPSYKEVYYNGDANCMIVYTDESSGSYKTWIGTADTVDWNVFASNPNAFVSPVTYYGRTAKASNAHLIYGIAIDIDYVSPESLDRLFFQIYEDIIPAPTYLVNSGTGIHAYYVFIDPIPAYPTAVKALNDFKHALTHLIWNSYTSAVSEIHHRDGTIEDFRQYQSIVQGYRIVGSSTKLGFGVKTHAYRIWKEVDPFDLNRYLETSMFKDGKNPAELTPDKLMYKSDTSLEEAKKLYPKWYQARIVEKRAKLSWRFKTDLYEKWKEYVYEQAKVGHRYYCIGSIAVMAVKCGIDKDKLVEDCLSLLDYLDRIGYDPKSKEHNHFSEKDLSDAINSFYKPENAFYSRKSIEFLTAVKAPPTKRNYRKQNVHLEFARAAKDLKIKFNEKSKAGRSAIGGRPSKEDIVKNWRIKNPEGKKIDCEKETGLSRHTIIKFWK